MRDYLVTPGASPGTGLKLRFEYTCVRGYWIAHVEGRYGGTRDLVPVLIVASFQLLLRTPSPATLAGG